MGKLRKKVREMMEWEVMDWLWVGGGIGGRGEGEANIKRVGGAGESEHGIKVMAEKWGVEL